MLILLKAVQARSAAFSRTLGGSSKFLLFYIYFLMEFLIVFDSEHSNKHHMIDSDKIQLLKTLRKSKNVIL